MKWRKTNNAKRVSSGCRNHGSCPVCRGNRTAASRRAEPAPYREAAWTADEDWWEAWCDDEDDWWFAHVDDGLLALLFATRAAAAAATPTLGELAAHHR